MKKPKQVDYNDIPTARLHFNNIDDIFQQLEIMPGFGLEKNYEPCFCFETERLRGRMLYKEDNGWFNFQFSYKQYFDRWANSTNFNLLVYSSENWVDQLIDMKKAVEFIHSFENNKYFDWDSYFYTIQIPLFLKVSLRSTSPKG